MDEEKKEEEVQTLKSRHRTLTNVTDATIIDRPLQSAASSPFTSFRQNVNVPSQGAVRSINQPQSSWKWT